MYESEQIYPLEVANRAEQFTMRTDPRHTRIICRKEDLSLSKLLGLSLVITKQSESNIDFFLRDLVISLVLISFFLIEGVS